MKKTLIMILLLTITITSLITAASRCYVSGNTFKIPSGNEENNQYHTYNIDDIGNKTNNHQNKQNNNIPKNNSHSTNTNNIPEVKHFYNNTNNDKNKSTNNKPNNNKPNNNKPNNNKPNNNKPNNNKPANTISTNKPKKSRKKTYKKQNPDTITKIEFQNHFIKIKAGSSKNILLETHPAKSQYTGMVYKSNNNSIAVYKDNKLTAIKRGFTTILIMLKDGTVKAACPVKVV